MRADPNAGLGDLDDGTFHGDNQNRISGDARQLASMQLYQFEANDKGQNIHLNSDPTTVELMNKIYRDKKESLKTTKSNKILDKYGGQEHMTAPSTELLFAQTDRYVEYDKTGAVMTGQERAIAKSKYVEDVLTHNHAFIWGSYFDQQSFRWGYADDHSTILNSHGTGEAGKLARDAAIQAALQVESGTKIMRATSNGTMAPPMKALYGSADQLSQHKLDEVKLRTAIRVEQERQQSEPSDDRKRKFNSMQSDELTPEVIEAYHLSKPRHDDPMVNFADVATDEEA